MYYWGIDTTFIAFSVLSGMIMLFKRKDPFHLRLFPFFLLYTLLNELFAGYLVERYNMNTEIYNIYGIVQFIFYTYLLSKFITSKIVVKLIRFLQPLYVLLSFLNLLFFQKMKVYNSITFAIGCIGIVSLCIYYFFEIFKQKKVVYLTREPAFWISTGLLFFFTCSFPLIATANLIDGLPSSIIFTLQNLLTLLNVLLYSIFTISFLCQIKIQKHISSL